MALSMAQLHLLAKDDQNEVQHDFLMMYWNWQWCGHMMTMASKMAQLYSLHQDNQKAMQHDFLVI